MSRDLKDLINALEEKNEVQTDYELTFRELKEEVGRLKFTNKEQKILIQEQKEKLSKKLEVPEDIQLLKDVIVSQRQEIRKKEKDIEILEQKLQDLEINSEFPNNSGENEDLINAQKLIIQLTEENEMYRLNESSAKKLITELNELNEKHRRDSEKLKAQLEKLGKNSSESDSISTPSPGIDIYSIQKVDESNKKILELEEEKEKLKKKLETADITHNNLIDEINVISKDKSDLNKEISEKNIKINVLNEKLESLKRQNSELKENLANIQNLENITKEKAEIGELEKLRSENLELKNSINEFSERKLSIESLEADNINLNNVISELIQNQTQLVNYNLSSDQSLPKYYQTNLFMRIFNILDNPKKDLIIRTLIQDLITTPNNDIKRSVINLLSSIKDNRIYDALIKMINNEDWLIRLYIIKTLYKFDVNEIKDHFTEPLKALLKDKDSDVRDAASRILNYIYNGG